MPLDFNPIKLMTEGAKAVLDLFNKEKILDSKVASLQKKRDRLQAQKLELEEHERKVKKVVTLTSEIRTLEASIKKLKS